MSRLRKSSRSSLILLAQRGRRGRQTLGIHHGLGRGRACSSAWPEGEEKTAFHYFLEAEKKKTEGGQGLPREKKLRERAGNRRLEIITPVKGRCENTDPTRSFCWCTKEVIRLLGRGGGERMGGTSRGVKGDEHIAPSQQREKGKRRKLQPT